jgi:3-oxoacyl-[acyl-carrier-protein] synthase II
VSEVPARGTHVPVVTGMGAVSAVGLGCAALRDALDQGRDGIARITRFSTEGLSTSWGAVVPGARARPAAASADETYALCVEFARLAAREAWDEARVEAAGLPPARIALVLGTSVGGHAQGLHRITEAVAGQLGLRGPCLTVSTACSSSAGALDLARALLECGDADLVVAGGSDVLSVEVFAGFSALGLLCGEKCAPFGSPYGTTLGEGAGFLILESAAQARARGLRPRAVLRGFGLSADAYHATSPDPAGAGVARAMQLAIADAGLGPEDIGYVNAHGTGTVANDTAEWKGIRAVFGARAERLPVSATKSYLGHAQGAAGVLELVATVLCLERDLIPPTLRHTSPRAFSPPDPVAGDRPRVARVEHALCTSSAFGGANAVVVVGKREVEPVPRARQPVFVLGAGWVGPAGVGSGRHPDGCAEGAVPTFDLQAMVPSFDVHGLDPASRFLLGAAARALVDGGIAVRGPLRERVGLLVGAQSASATSAAEFQRSIVERGLHQLSAVAFTRLVLNAATGICCQALALRGPTTTLSTGWGSGLLAIVGAAERLAVGQDAEVLVAGAFDERSLTEPQAAEGAACLVLGRTERARANGRAPVRAAGWAVGPAGDFSATAARALARAGLPAASVDCVHGDAAALRAWGKGQGAKYPAAPAAQSAFAAAAAYDELGQGSAWTALVGAANGASASVALVLMREEGTL